MRAQSAHMDLRSDHLCGCGEVIRMQCLDGGVNGCCQSAQNPLAAKGKLLSSQHISRCLEAVTQVDHSKLDGVPQLVTPVAVCYHALDVQVDVPSLQHTHSVHDKLVKSHFVFPT